MDSIYLHTSIVARRVCVFARRFPFCDSGTRRGGGGKVSIFSVLNIGRKINFVARYVNNQMFFLSLFDEFCCLPNMTLGFGVRVERSLVAIRPKKGLMRTLSLATFVLFPLDSDGKHMEF